MGKIISWLEMMPSINIGKVSVTACWDAWGSGYRLWGVIVASKNIHWPIGLKLPLKQAGEETDNE